MEENWIDEWKDVTPVSQNDGADPVCPIAYSNECTFFFSFIKTTTFNPAQIQSPR